MSYYDNETRCPKCGHYSTNADSCEHCGALISKIRERELQQDVTGHTEDARQESVPLQPAEAEPGVSFTAITVVIIMLGLAGGLAYYKSRGDEPAAVASTVEAADLPENVIFDPQATPIYNFAKAAPVSEPEPIRREKAVRAEPQKTEPEQGGLFSSIADAIKTQVEQTAAPGETAPANVPSNVARPSSSSGQEVAFSQPAKPTVGTAPTPVQQQSGRSNAINIGEGEISSSNFSIKASEQPKKVITTPSASAAAPAAAAAQSGGLGKRNVVAVDSSSFNREVLSHSSQPVLVDFYATWCGPCKRLAPQLEVFAGLNEKVKVVKIDIDQNRDLAMKYKIQSVPTLILFKNGQMLGRDSGVPSMSQLQASIQPHL